MNIFTRLICRVNGHNYKYNILKQDPAKHTCYRHVWGIRKKCTRCGYKVKRYFDRETMIYLEKKIHEK